MNVGIEVVQVVTDEVVGAFGRLLPQLSRTAKRLDAEALRMLVEWYGNQLLVARVDGEIVGALTLVLFPIPTGLRAWIEDVVVDEGARGRGIGGAFDPGGRPAGTRCRGSNPLTDLAAVTGGGEPAVRAPGVPATGFEGVSVGHRGVRTTWR